MATPWVKTLPVTGVAMLQWCAMVGEHVLTSCFSIVYTGAVLKLEVFKEYLPPAEYGRDMHRYRLTQKSGDEPPNGGYYIAQATRTCTWDRASTVLCDRL